MCIRDSIYEPAPQVRDLNPQAPGDLQRIIRRCLAKDKDERYQTIKDVAIELKDLRRELESMVGSDMSVPPQVTADSARDTDVRTAIKSASTTSVPPPATVSSAEYITYTHLRAHETPEHLVCR